MTADDQKTFEKDFIQLNRTFRPFSEEETVSRWSEEGDSWAQILEHRYVVVLGEAGTGKTAEFKNQAKALTNAWFVRLDILAEKGLNAALKREKKNEFQTWRSSEEDGVFFLDALDEAKLKHRSLEDALLQLSNELDAEWPRVRWVISCRVSDWMAMQDRQTIKEFIPEGADIHIVQLAPLTESQVEALAKSKNVKNIPEFMAALRDSSAHEFIERPLDVGWLGSYWNSKGKIGTLRELIENNIDEKLKEWRSDRPDNLSLVEAKKAVRALAGLATLQETFSFCLPDEGLNSDREEGALNPEKVLTDWSKDDLKLLLRRPIFDEANYGRIRFHHHSVQTFLAAQWLLDNGWPRSKLNELLFVENGDDCVIPEYLQPVAAWLALWDEEIRQKLIQKAPSLLIAYGDPSALSDDERLRVLNGWADKYKGREWIRERFDPASLKRFAHPSLAERINELLSDSDISEGLAAWLFELVEAGKIFACADKALEIAKNPSGKARHDAIYAAAAAGNEKHREELWAITKTENEWSPGLSWAFIESLYPEKIGVADLMELFDKTQNPSKSAHRYLFEVLLAHFGTPELRLELLGALLEKIHLIKEDSFSCSCEGLIWAAPLIANLVKKILNEHPEKEATPPQLLNALELLHFGYSIAGYYWQDAKKDFEKHPRIRRELFWQVVERAGFEKEKRWEVFVQLYPGLLIGADKEWLIEDARSRQDVRDQLFAFKILQTLLSSKPDELLKILEETSKGIPELENAFEQWLNSRLSQSHDEEDKKLKNRVHHIYEVDPKFLEWINSHLDEIRSGSNFNVLYNFYLYFEENFEDFSAESIQEKCGPKISEAAISGFRAFWKKNKELPWPHEFEKNKTPYVAIIGLTGLNFDFQQGLEATSLTPDEARLATRYALWELKGFPGWFNNLTEAHLSEVVETLRPALLADLKEPDDDSNSQGYVLYKLFNTTESLKNACAEIILEWLRENKPLKARILEEALLFVLKCDVSNGADLSELAPQCCRASLSKPEHFAIWWCVWLTRNASMAVDFLGNALKEFDGNERDAFVEEIFLCLQRIVQAFSWSKEKFPPEKFPQMFESNPLALKRLISIAYSHIRTNEDIEHENMVVYSTGPRDHLQSIRGTLINWLEAIPGQESVDALRCLSEEPNLHKIRDRLLYLADQRLEKNANEADSPAANELIQIYRDHGTKALNQLKPERYRDMKQIDGALEKVDVFISYASEDSGYAERLHQAFQKKD
jgi:hypothetical protein